jgi:hypothetical protein
MKWIPKVSKIEQEIEKEKLRLELQQEASQEVLQSIPEPLPTPTQPIAPVWTPPITPTFETAQQPTFEPFQFAPEEPRQWMTQEVFAPQPVVQNVPQPQPVVSTATAVKPTAKKAPAIPFWQRALEVFSAPFNWVDETIIKPALGTVATTVGLNDMPRLAGEDFFEWKKRTWENWEAPGIDLNVPWAKDKIRIDIKGIAEFAPWLLLPGAGQVGTGVRAGVGVAGALGKAGKVGKVLGTAVELSPWGLAEKATGAVMKAAVKATGKASSKVGESVFGKIPEKKVSPTVDELTKFFDEQVIPQRKAFEKELPTLRARQENASREAFSKARRGEITYDEATAIAEKSTAGGIKQGFAVQGGQFTPEKVTELLGDVINASERGLTTRDTAIALQSLLLKGDLPEPHHIREFAKIFGDKFAESVSRLSSAKQSKLDNVLDWLNIPRSVLASGDISGVARQGLILGLVHPTQVPKSFGRMMKSLFSEKMAVQTDDVMRADPLFREFVDIAEGYIAPISKTARIGAREESFASQLAEHLPFVRRSERAFITYLNELRFGAYKAARNSMVAQGATEPELKMLGKFINLASGRGELPKSLEKYAASLNTVLFSPRLQASTLELPFQIGKMLTSKNPYMRKEAAKALVTFVGGGTALLMLLKNSGVAKVEFDPRSSDFGKIKIGETRLDIWRGYAQYARFMAQMLTGQSKSAYGNMSKKDRYDTAYKFLQSKSSPALGLIVDLLKGENYMGDPLFEGTTSTLKAAKERIMPLMLQDIMDAMEQSGVNGLWTAAPASIGIGTLTYIDEYVKAKDKIAKDMGFNTWDEIDPKTQKEIFNRSAELQAAQIQLDRRVMDTAWGEWRSAGNAIEDNFRADIDQITAQYRITKDGVKFRNRITDAFTARRGAYEAREKDERFEEIVSRMNIEDTAEAMIAMSPEQLAIKTYNDALYGDDMYDEFGEYRFDEARIRKDQLKQSLGQELFDYVEDYQGVKYETFPPEFQEFQKAKEVLAPYWAIATKVEKTFGTAFANSNAGQRLITKLRKAERLKNSTMERYYQMFYAQNT